MQILTGRKAWAFVLILSLAGFTRAATAAGRLDIGTGWQLQAAGDVAETGAAISSPDYRPANWHPAIVPGTVLASLVGAGVYPEPLYGENNRPDKIPETLCRQDYWYRAVFTAPKDYAGKKIWLNFDGINYAAEVWVNGQQAGTIKGAFIRGVFDVTALIEPGKPAAVAVRISPQPHPGTPHEHTLAAGMGGNGGITALDGPTFLCSMGWDWIPAIRDRNSGIWRKVFLSATGPVRVKDPLVTTDLPLPDVSSADVGIQVTLQNVSDQPQRGVLKISLGENPDQKNAAPTIILKPSFTKVTDEPVELPPHSEKTLSFDSKTIALLHLQNPKLWWPNGFGPQNLYTLNLSFEVDGQVSDQQSVKFGVRKITYSVPDSENLTLSVNGVRVFCKGGNWGMDEAMKRIPRERLEAQIRMHQIANYTIIRNWVGQSTSEDFYDLCDQYGILLWDEFFQPNPSDGPNPDDIETYMANVRDKILRFRNHPSIAVWCARNEGFPPKEIDDRLRVLMKELEPTRLYQPSSTSGRGVNSGGPYSSGRPPRAFYDFGEAFKTEIGSASIPTLESIQGMMPQKDWESINDDWAEHDLAKGASGGEGIRKTIEDRYGKIVNLADFVRKAQLLNYETFRAMYEGRLAKMFHPSSGVITWMSNPAQPSFVWQIYHHDLEPNSSLFAVKSACEPVHVMLNEKTGHLMVVNNLPTALTNATAHVALYSPDGTVVASNNVPVNAAFSAVTDLGEIDFLPKLLPVYFVKLILRDAQMKTLSENFYWRAAADRQDDLRELEAMPVVTLWPIAVRRDKGDKCFLDVTLHNPSSQIALMTHLQLRRQASGERVLPVYYSDNYVSLLPDEQKVITIEAAQADLKGETPLIAIDGWNVKVLATTNNGVVVALNENAQVSHWPETGLPIVPSTYVFNPPPSDRYQINCGGDDVGSFTADLGYRGGNLGGAKRIAIDTSAPGTGPAALYQTERWGECTYTLPVKPLPAGRAYTARLHFAETTFDADGKRRFNVKINGQNALADFDPFRAAGAKNKAVVKEFPGLQPNADGQIVIQFENGQADQPEINAIEVLAGK